MVEEVKEELREKAKPVSPKPAKTKIEQQVLSRLRGKNVKALEPTDNLTLPIANLQLREGMVLGLVSSFNGELFLTNTRYKIKQVRPNGSLVLRSAGKLREV